MVIGMSITINTGRPQNVANEKLMLDCNDSENKVENANNYDQCNHCNCSSIPLRWRYFFVLPNHISWLACSSKFLYLLSFKF